MNKKEKEIKKDETKEEEENTEEEEDEEEEDSEEVEKSFKKLLDTYGEGAKGEIKEELKAEVEKIVKSEVEKKKARAGIYNEKVQKETVRKEKNESLRKFCKAVLEEDRVTLKEMTTDDEDSPYAGYAVDSELSAEIRHLTTEYGVARREMTTHQLTKNSYKANELVTDVSAFWTDEGSQIDSSQVVLGQNTLELKKLASIVTLTAELLEEEEIDLFSFIAGRVAEQFVKKEDEAFFIGDGSLTYGEFTGLLESENVNEVIIDGTSFGDVDADDLIDMQDSTPQGAQSNAKYFMDRTILSTIRKLTDDNGQYIYQRPSGGLPATIWDKPFVLVEAMPSISDSAKSTSFILYGDLKKGCIMGYKGAIRAQRFNAGVVRSVDDNGDINLITSDREAMRFIERVGYMEVITSLNVPITKLTTAASSA